MSKVRIESKWYHESDNFFLVAVDALSLADQYIKVALFELFTPNPAPGSADELPPGMMAPPSRQYSVDIGTNIADGSSLGIEGAPSTHSAKVCSCLGCCFSCVIVLMSISNSNYVKAAELYCGVMLICNLTISVSAAGAHERVGGPAQ